MPKTSSHKGQNGRLLVIAGSEKYHGSLLYCIKAASKIVDLIYVLTPSDNRKLVEKLKERTASFISHSELDSESIFRQPGFRLPPKAGRQGRNYKMYDCVLIGPGMGVSQRTRKLVRQVLRSGIRAVLDASAIRVLDSRLKALLNKKHILTPYSGEWRAAFGITTKLTIVQSVVKLFGCTVVLKGKIDIVAGPEGKLALNKTGNEGMTKGGTGDVLAGLIAAFYCRNDAFTSAAAGAYINGLAGDELYEKVGPFYDAEDLVQQIPKTLWKLVKHKIRNARGKTTN